MNSICGLSKGLKLTQMFILTIRITLVDNTGDFQKICVSFESQCIVGELVTLYSAL